MIHGSDVPRSKLFNQFWSVNRYHRSLNYPLSRKGFSVGYHRFITGGKNYLCREDNEMGAHCNTVRNGQTMNLQSLGVCVGGDYDDVYMYSDHFKLLQEQVLTWQDYWKIPDERVVFHRHFNENKTCPGTLLDEAFLKRLLTKKDPVKTLEETDKQKLLLKQLTLLQKLRDILLRLLSSLYKK